MDTVIKLIRKYGKDVNHVFKILYTLDEKLKEKGIIIQVKKKV